MGIVGATNLLCFHPTGAWTAGLVAPGIGINVSVAICFGCPMALWRVWLAVALVSVWRVVFGGVLFVVSMLSAGMLLSGVLSVEVCVAGTGFWWLAE